MQARAYWITGPRQGTILTEELNSPGSGQALVRTLYSGVSRGTELLVHRHEVPSEVAEQMRAPHQEGLLPDPVKYGYLNVGVVEQGPEHLTGRRVFCLFPHQDRYVVDASDLRLIPDDVPSPRAVLAGTIETAVNAIWDSGITIGDRVSVVGGGMVGLSLALLLRRFPLARLEVVDVDPTRTLPGVELRSPGKASTDADVVFHTSATADGLATGLSLLGDEGTLIELSWYGTQTPGVPLGGSFHARRLNIKASQVSRISPARAARRGFGDRMSIALDALRDDAFDALLSPPVDFDELPAAFAELDAGGGSPLCTLVTYPQEK